MKRLLYLLTLALLPTLLWAEDVSFRAEAPAQVVIGKPFQLRYTVNQRARDLQAPEFTDFDFLAGPYSSTSSSTSFVNGKRSSSFTQTYTYTLAANKVGTFTISPATIRVDGDTYTSNGVRIEVLPADEQPASSQQPSGTSQQSSQSQASASAGGDNIFIRTIVNKTTVHEQEALVLSYKLYFAGVDVAQFTNNTKLPEFDGFLKQEIEQGEIQTELEHYNGRNYQTAVLYQTLLYPQHSGDIKIEPAQFEAVLRVQVRQQVRSIFDDFFGSYTNVTRALTAPGVTIHSEALPKGKPANFSGGVGQFSLTGDISATELKANDAVTVRLTIQGAGNMKMLKSPAIDWPEGFETYDPKVTNKLKQTTQGMSGTREIEYLAIPRSAGTYSIPAVTFSYFDTRDNQYKTLSVGGWTLHIARSESEGEQTAVVQNYVNKEDIKQLGTDIRYISTGELQGEESRSSNVVFGTWTYRLCFILPLLIAVVLFIVFRRRIAENADRVRMRYKKANKVAQKRLREAKKAMDNADKTTFYEAIERAAWTYLSDRLSIPTANLNKDNIESILRGKNVDDTLIAEVREVLSVAEQARYAPTTNSDMEQLYSRTATLINQLENQKL
ncbi:MAG: protein BatD [Paludibacteraceae bacterium]|nr:protein BatD [Paludibacteraceae bacterium]MBR1922319.1 protein BatD [Paludibacteraceae bacterium]